MGDGALAGGATVRRVPWASFSGCWTDV